jgi:hypothetical protein
MKYYMYISDTKIDMLLSQMPNEVKRRTRRSIMLPLIKVELGPAGDARRSAFSLIN